MRTNLVTTMVQMGVNPDTIMLNFLSLLAFKESNPNWFLAKALGKKACLENHSVNRR